MESRRKQIGIIGSGNWGSAISKLLAENVQKTNGYEQTINMWVFEEKIDGRNLSEIINTEHENKKYLPGIKLPENVHAVTDIKKVVESADILVFVVPHQFLDKILEQIEGQVKSTAIGITLIKGAIFKNGKYGLISECIERRLNIPICSLMGANIASDVAEKKFSETTLEGNNEKAGKEMEALFSTSYFKPKYIKNYGIAETCGVLKNVVALGCGIVEGKGYSSNAVAAVIRNGFLEIIRFCDTFLEKTSRDGLISDVFMESCGIADIIVSCSSGRNFRYSKMAAEKGVSIPEIEKSEMNGQHLQGYSTGKELKVFLEETKKEKIFPFLYAICIASQSSMSAEDIIHAIP